MSKCRGCSGLAARRVEELLQAGGQFLRKAGGPGGIHQAKFNQVPEVRAVLVAESGELDPHEGFQVEHPEKRRICRIADIGFATGSCGRTFSLA